MKIAITGGPCCGKSTIIQRLREKGYQVIDEAAREIIEKKGYSKNLDRYPGEALQLQLDIHALQIEKERDIDDSQIVFLDRGYIDTYSYCRHLIGFVPQEIMAYDLKRYDLVFFLERIPIVDDGLRRETEVEAAMLHTQILEAYRQEGYDPIIIPISSIDERVKKIIETAENSRIKSSL